MVFAYEPRNISGKQNIFMSYILRCADAGVVNGGVSIYVCWCACIPGPLPLSTPCATPRAECVRCVSLDTQLWLSPASNLTKIIPHFSLYFSKEKKGWGLYLIVHTLFITIFMMHVVGHLSCRDKGV